MKKIILSFILGVGFGAFGYASSASQSSTQDPQKKETVKKEKVERYDFSLFKFVTPSIYKSKTDTVGSPIEKKKSSKFKEDTTYLFSRNYEKPLRSFKLS